MCLRVEGGEVGGHGRRRGREKVRGEYFIINCGAHFFIINIAKVLRDCILISLMTKVYFWSLMFASSFNLVLYVWKIHF